MVITRMYADVINQCSSQEPLFQNEEAKSFLADAHLSQDYKAMAGLQNSYQSRYQTCVKQSIADMEKNLLTNTNFKTINSSNSNHATTDASMNIISNNSGIAMSESQNRTAPLKNRKYNKKKHKVGTYRNTRSKNSNVSFNNSLTYQGCKENNSYSYLTLHINSNSDHELSNANLQCPNKRNRNCGPQKKIITKTDSQLNCSTESGLSKQLLNNDFETFCTSVDQLNQTIPTVDSELNTTAELEGNKFVICISSEIKKEKYVSILDVISQIKQFDKMVDDLKSTVINKLNLETKHLEITDNEKLTADMGEKEADIFSLEDEYKQVVHDENKSIVSTPTTNLNQLPKWENCLDKYKTLFHFKA